MERHYAKTNQHESVRAGTHEYQAVPTRTSRYQSARIGTNRHVFPNAAAARPELAGRSRWTGAGRKDTVCGMDGGITIIGDGAMGTVCSILLAENGLPVRLWSAFPDAAERLAATRENGRFLPGCRVPEAVEVTGRDEGVFDGAGVPRS